MSRSHSGSTMTLNTIANAKDDISIYNGDENHKVWAGSQDNLDGIYDVYSTSTISRPSRPRQIAQPVAVPPPPVKEKKKRMKGKSLSGSREDLYHPLMNGKASSVSGTMIKQKQSMHQMSPGPQPIYIMAPPHPGTLPNPKFFKHHGLYFVFISRIYFRNCLICLSIYFRDSKITMWTHWVKDYTSRQILLCWFLSPQEIHSPTGPEEKCWFQLVPFRLPWCRWRRSSSPRRPCRRTRRNRNTSRNPSICPATEPWVPWPVINRWTSLTRRIWCSTTPRWSRRANRGRAGRSRWKSRNWIRNWRRVWTAWTIPIWDLTSRLSTREFTGKRDIWMRGPSRIR